MNNNMKITLIILNLIKDSLSLCNYSIKTSNFTCSYDITYENQLCTEYIFRKCTY